MTKEELLDTIKLLERLGGLRDLWLDEPSADPILEMSLHLMRRHLTGQLTTPTSLAQSASVPYTTATRRVSWMQAQGLLDLRPRTRTGRTFSAHPSPKLIARMTAFLDSVRSAIGDCPSDKPRLSANPARAADTIIQSPSIASRASGFDQGLSILILDDPAYSFSPAMQRELNYLMGGQVHFTQRSIDELRNEILYNAEQDSSHYDVVAVDLPMITEFALRGILSALDEIAAQSELNSADFVSAAWRAASVNGRQYAIPVFINPQLLFYRKDLLSRLGVAPPATIAELLAIARRLHDPDNGRYGVSWTAARGAPAGQAFLQFHADFGQPVFPLQRAVGGFNTDHLSPASQQPKIDSQIGHATAHFMLELLKFSPPDVLDTGWDGQVSLLREGRVAMAYEWASRATQVTGFSSAGDLGFLPHPTGHLIDATTPAACIAPIGGFAFGIPASISDDRRRIAWNAIEWLASPEVLKLQAQHGGLVTTRTSVGSDPDVQRLSPMIPAVDHMLRRGQIRLWPRPPVANHAAVVAILGEEIHDMLSGRQSVDQALKRAQERAAAG